MTQHRFIVTIEHKFKGTSLSHHVYAKNQWQALSIAMGAFKRLQARNETARLYKLQGVVYEPEENKLA